ncbi:MAG: hypothetical protein NTW33_00835 [Methanoregula sp.]|nr:hypothetical protein [Methanoregula sp.]
MIEGFRTPSRFCLASSGIGHDILDFHIGCNSSPVKPVYFDNCPFDTPAGIRDLATDIFKTNIIAFYHKVADAPARIGTIVL